ncbi:MAG: NHL repeat-containing protein [candidate division WOR-3 bacterium]
MMRLSKLHFIHAWVFGLLLCALPTAAALNLLERRAIKFTRMFQEVQMAPAALVEHKGEYYVTDMKGNRILVFNRQGKLRRTIGVVGSGPGELLRPAELAISKDDLIHVLEGGNERVQIMTLEGKYVNHFPIGYTQGFAISSKGEIFFGQPEKGKLISVYSRRGQLIKSFGDLRKVSDFYGQAYAQKNKVYELLINRVDICIDRSDNVYATFRFAPVLQKYDPNGRLLWEVRLQGSDIDTLVNLFLTDEKNRKFIRIGTDGQHANLVLLNAVVNQHTGNICVLLPNKVLYVLDGQGKRLHSFDLVPADPKDRDVWPEGLTLNASGEIVLIDSSRCVLLERRR